MSSKQAILDNVAEYSAEQLYEYILSGTVSFEELCRDTEGEFHPNVRREVKRMLESGDADAWDAVQKEHTIDAVDRYLRSFPDGEFRDAARDLKSKLKAEASHQERAAVSESDWKSVDKRSIGQLRAYVDSYPGSRHALEASKIINSLLLAEVMGIGADTLASKIKEIQTSKRYTLEQKDNNIIDAIKDYVLGQKISRGDFLALLAEDHNLLSAGIVKRLMSEGIINVSDLLSIGIDREFIGAMSSKCMPDDFTYMTDLAKINKPSTEIYFWGIPSSGKSCAIGAILSVAGNGTVAKVMDKDSDSQGYGYMTYLASHFTQGGVSTLLGGTPIEAFYEMGFDLIDYNNRVHPITCIDMAGELMKCMYKANANIPLSSTELKMLDSMTKVLIDNRSTNRKIHIFVIEYGAEDRLYEGYHQSVYLEGAVSYIKSTGIFEKETDAIYIMITKADKMKNPSTEALSRHITDNYLGFYNGLVQICEDNEINGRRVEKIAFSLGQVCFQNFCRFDPRPAANVVNLLLQRSASFKNGKLENIARNLRK